MDDTKLRDAVDILLQCHCPTTCMMLHWLQWLWIFNSWPKYLCRYHSFTIASRCQGLVYMLAFSGLSCYEAMSNSWYIPSQQLFSNTNITSQKFPAQVHKTKNGLKLTVRASELAWYKGSAPRKNRNFLPQVFFTAYTFVQYIRDGYGWFLDMQGWWILCKEH